MTTAQLLDITFELWGAFFCIIGAATILVPGRKMEAEIKLSNILLGNAFLLLSDALAWYFRGDVSKAGYYAVRLSNLFCFVLSFAMILLYEEYIMCYLDRDSIQCKILNKATYFICIFNFCLLALNTVTGWEYYFDNSNYYHRGFLYPLMMISAFALFAYILIIIIMQRKAMTSLRFGLFVGFNAILAGSFVFSVFFYGISTVYLVVTISSMMAFFTTQVEKSQLLVEQERQVNDMKTKILLSQIQPHFLFNSLTAIYYLCVKDPKKAQTSIGDFSKFLRANLDSLGETAPVSFEQEMNHVENFLKLEELRYEGRLHVEMECPETDFKVPALTIQPLVENAVKYGASKTTEEVGQVLIKTEKAEDGAITIMVQDNGQGYDINQPHEDGRSHVGLDNVRYRLKDMMGADLEIRSVIGQGTTVLVTIPANRVIRCEA